MRLIIALMLGLAAAVSPVGADPLDALRTPGAILLMRHALAPGTGDPAEFRLGDCTTQRNLDERGRAQARAVGAALRAADIPIDRVWTSEWCRTRETATLLGLGTPIEQPLLNSFFRDRSSGPAQTEALRRALAALPRLDRPILITHQVNITALTGVVPQSGEIVAIAHAPDGDITLLGRVMAAR